jgi:dienelactone hydrolase
MKGVNMVHIVLFHHAQGLTPGVVAFADRLRGAGHIVHTPDLFEGRTFNHLDKGVAFVNTVGFGEIVARGEQAVDSLTGELVYAGFSLGVIPAQKLAQTRAGAQGAILMHSCLLITEFGSAWPKGVPVQVHAMDADPFFVNEGDIDAARDLVKEVEQAELFLYPGDTHIFTDISLPSYDVEASSLLLERVIDFLTHIDGSRYQ